MKRKLGQTLKKLWNDESGQTTTEYILIVAVVVAIVLKLKDELVTQLESIIGRTTGASNRILDGLE